jgi:hypothetical protein
MKVQTCTRPAPHKCTINGPCNGFPKPECDGRPYHRVSGPFGSSYIEDCTHVRPGDWWKIGIAYTLIISFLLLALIEISRGVR